MTYPNIQIHDVETGEITNREMTDGEYLSFWSSLAPTVLVSSTPQQIPLNGVSSVIFRLFTAYKLDGFREPIARQETIVYKIDGQEYSDTTDANGILELEFVGLTAGQFVVSVVNYEGNEITIEVLNA